MAHLTHVLRNAPMRGIVCGTVVTSHHPDYAEGALVSGLGFWADYQIGIPQTVKPMGNTGLVPVVEAFSTFALADLGFPACQADGLHKSGLYAATVDS